MKNKINILVVEDELISLIYLENILNELGFKNIFKAEGSEEAIKIVKNHKIDLLLMDLNIKGSLDGILTAKLLNNEYIIPVIYVTGESASDIITDSLYTNIYGYIIKPFNKSTFIASFNIALKQINEELFQKKKEKIMDKNNDVIHLYKGYKFNISNNTCYFNNIAINLTKKELDLLKYLISNININISYEMLKNNLWQNQEIANTTLRDLISRLKKKLPYLNINNVSNIGYILKNHNTD